jgi:hypothetical protein
MAVGGVIERFSTIPLLVWGYVSLTGVALPLYRLASIHSKAVATRPRRRLPEDT